MTGLAALPCHTARCLPLEAAMPQQRRIQTVPGCPSVKRVGAPKLTKRGMLGGKMREEPCEQGLSGAPGGMGMCVSSDEALPTWPR